MRQAAMLLIFGFALVVIFFMYLAGTLAIVQQHAVVDVAAGEAEVLLRGGGERVPAEVGRLVRAGDVVRTGPDGCVHLRWVRWAGGMRIKIGPEARFEVVRAVRNRSTEDEESRLRVDRGKIWVRLRRALTGRSKFEVETPTVVAAVRGTVFSVAVAENGATEVEVLEGQVKVTGTEGAEGTLTGGSQTRLGSGQRSVATRPLTLEELESWREEVGLVGPFLAVASPADGITVEGEAVEVSGRAEPGVAVRVNQQEATVSERGAFSVRVPLEMGSNTIVVRARDRDGRETRVERAISRAAAAEAGR